MSENFKFSALAQQYFSYSQEKRRDFHRNPELGYKEIRTAGIIASELTSLGYSVHSGIAETGVVGLLEGSQPGATVLMRFDMDALPVMEETQADYQSENPGVMHACGHDGHMAIGLTVARMLAGLRAELRGQYKFVFQPAEEGLGGAERMIAEGVLENPIPDYALALHLWNEKPLGWLAATPAPMMAGADIFTIKIIGKGGHGALPETTIDPVIAAAQVVLALQAIVSRNVSPLKAAVVSVTQITGGSTFNVIPPEVELKGTIRTFDKAVQQLVIHRMQEIVKNICAAMACQVDIHITPLTPALRNDPVVAAVVQQTATELFPNIHQDNAYRCMGSEDMAFFLEQIPGCLFFVGSANPDKGLIFSHHHPKFDFDEQVLATASAIMASAAAHLAQS